MRSGVVLAGGRSTRFGDADKAVASLAGVPMIRRVADRVAPVVSELVVNCRSDQRDAIEDALAGVDPSVRFAVDPVEDEGPLAGVRNGLHAADAEYALVVACDMPFVDAAFVDHLFERASGVDAAVPRVDDWYQPTQAVYRSTAMETACERALAAGERRTVAPLSDLDHVVVGEDEVKDHAGNGTRTFVDLNTREAFEDAASSLERG